MDTSLVTPDVKDFTKEWKRLRQQKHRQSGGVEARIITALAMVEGEQYVQQARGDLFARPLVKEDDKNRLHLIFNLIMKARARKIGRLWSIANVFRASPNKQEAQSIAQAEVIGKLLKGLNRKVREDLRHWERLSWLVDAGVVVEHTTWEEDITEEPIPAFDPDTNELLWRDAANPDPNAVLTQSIVEQMVMQGQTPERFTVIEQMTLCGDVRSEVVSPLNCFIDASVPTIKQLGHDQSFSIAKVKTVEWIRKTFGGDVADGITSAPGADLSIIRTHLPDAVRGLSVSSLRDMIPAVAGSRDKDDPPMAIVITRYQPACPEYPHGRRSIYVPDQAMCDDGEIDCGEIPCIDIHYKAPTRSFWTGGFVDPLVVPQKFLNKRMSQMGEASNAQVYEVLLLGGTLSKQDIPSDMPGIIADGLTEDGKPNVAPMQRGQLPAWFIESIKLNIELFQQIASSDLMDHRQFPGQLRGPMALPMLQEILDSEDGPLYSHMGEQLAEIHQQRLNRVKQYYPGVRTLHYTGRNRKDAVLVFHTEQILRSGTDYQVVVDPGSLLPEFSALREARMIERLSGPLSILYIDKRTGKIDASQIAKELKYTDDETQDRQDQYRDLTQHFIGRLWEGQDGQELAAQILPFFDHATMLDELESVMATTEYMEASNPVRANFQLVYDTHRQYLAQIQESQMQGMQQQMMQGALAQATQQTAAKVAAETTDAALGQIRAQAEAAQANPPVHQLAAAIQAHHAQEPPPQG